MQKNKPSLLDWAFVTLREAAWAPLGIVGFYAIGLALHLYDLFPPLDIPSHLLGGVALTYFYRSAVRNSQSLVGDIPFPIQLLLAFTGTATTTILWEFYEIFMVLVLGFHIARGLEDTIMDMFWGLLGALLLSVFYRRR